MVDLESRAKARALSVSSSEGTGLWWTLFLRSFLMRLMVDFGDRSNRRNIWRLRDFCSASDAISVSRLTMSW